VRFDQRGSCSGKDRSGRLDILLQSGGEATDCVDQQEVAGMKNNPSVKERRRSKSVQPRGSGSARLDRGAEAANMTEDEMKEDQRTPLRSLFRGMGRIFTGNREDATKEVADEAAQSDDEELDMKEEQARGDGLADGADFVAEAPGTGKNAGGSELVKLMQEQLSLQQKQMEQQAEMYKWQIQQQAEQIKSLEELVKSHRLEKDAWQEEILAIKNVVHEQQRQMLTQQQQVAVVTPQKKPALRPADIRIGKLGSTNHPFLQKNAIVWSNAVKRHASTLQFDPHMLASYVEGTAAAVLDQELTDAITQEAQLDRTDWDDEMRDQYQQELYMSIVDAIVRSADEGEDESVEEMRLQGLHISQLEQGKRKVVELKIRMEKLAPNVMLRMLHEGGTRRRVINYFISALPFAARARVQDSLGSSKLEDIEFSTVFEKAKTIERNMRVVNQWESAIIKDLDFVARKNGTKDAKENKDGKTKQPRAFNAAGQGESKMTREMLTSQHKVTIKWQQDMILKEPSLLSKFVPFGKRQQCPCGCGQYQPFGPSGPGNCRKKRLERQQQQQQQQPVANLAQPVMQQANPAPPVMMMRQPSAPPAEAMQATPQTMQQGTMMQSQQNVNVQPQQGTMMMQQPQQNNSQQSIGQGFVARNIGEVMHAPENIQAFHRNNGYGFMAVGVSAELAGNDPGQDLAAPSTRTWVKIWVMLAGIFSGFKLDESVDGVINPWLSVGGVISPEWILLAGLYLAIACDALKLQVGLAFGIFALMCHYTYQLLRFLPPKSCDDEELKLLAMQYDHQYNRMVELVQRDSGKWAMVMHYQAHPAAMSRIGSIQNRGLSYTFVAAIHPVSGKIVSTPLLLDGGANGFYIDENFYASLASNNLIVQEGSMNDCLSGVGTANGGGNLISRWVAFYIIFPNGVVTQHVAQVANHTNGSLLFGTPQQWLHRISIDHEHKHATMKRTNMALEFNGNDEPTCVFALENDPVSPKPLPIYYSEQKAKRASQAFDWKSVQMQYPAEMTKVKAQAHMSTALQLTQEDLQGITDPGEAMELLVEREQQALHQYRQAYAAKSKPGIELATEPEKPSEKPSVVINALAPDNIVLPPGQPVVLRLNADRALVDGEAVQPIESMIQGVQLQANGVSSYNPKSPASVYVCIRNDTGVVMTIPSDVVVVRGEVVAIADQFDCKGRSNDTQLDVVLQPIADETPSDQSDAVKTAGATSRPASAMTAAKRTKPQQEAAAAKWFNRLLTVPMTAIFVILIGAGTGGLLHGLNRIKDQAGLQIAGVLEPDAYAVDLLANQFPEVKVIQHQISNGNFQASKALVQSLVPSHLWSHTWIHISKDALPPGLQHSNSQDVRLVHAKMRSVVRWAHNLEPRVMQITHELPPSIAAHVQQATANARHIDLNVYCPSVVFNNTVVVSSRIPLDLQPLDHARLRSTQDLFGPTHAPDGKELVVKVNNRPIQSARDPLKGRLTPTAIKIGKHVSEMARLSPEEHLLMMDWNEEIDWPNYRQREVSEAMKMRYVSQSTPPPLGELLGEAVRNAWPASIAFDENHVNLPSVHIVDGEYWRRLPVQFDLGFESLYINSARQALWVEDDHHAPVPAQILLQEQIRRTVQPLVSSNSGIPDTGEPEVKPENESNEASAPTAAPPEPNRRMTRSMNWNACMGDDIGADGEAMIDLFLEGAAAHFTIPLELHNDVSELYHDAENMQQPTTHSAASGSRPKYYPHRPWQTKPYEERYTVPWSKGLRDSRDRPIPFIPPHLEGKETYKVQVSTGGSGRGKKAEFGVKFGHPGYTPDDRIRPGLTQDWPDLAPNDPESGFL